MKMTIDEAIDTIKGERWINCQEKYIEAMNLITDTMRKYHQLKADYETHLKADMVAMLTELQLEIEEMKMESLAEKEIWNNAIGVCSDLIQQKIDSLKAESEDNLCDTCDNKACIFQSGIKRSKCDFYTSHLEPEAYPISENITKGFEEFTKMIFKQGMAESEDKE